MAHESVGKGIFLTASAFSEEAKLFAEEHKEKIFLIDGQRFISMISKLPEEKREILLQVAKVGLLPNSN
jgi:restriction endonuclease Mrr